MYRTFNDIADDVIAAIKAADTEGLFKNVSEAAVDNYSKLLKLISNTSGTPKAFVCIGGGDFANRAMTRSFSVAIVVVARYRSSEASKAESVWPLVEAAVKPFLPVVEIGKAPVFSEINSVKFEPKSWAPLDSGDYTATFVLELKATEVIKY